MKNEKLLTAIGKVDDNLIHNAAPKEIAKKKIAILKWGAIAACFAVAVFLAIPMFFNNSVEPPITADLAPMVFVNGNLYRQSTEQTFFEERKVEFDYIGEIGNQTDPLQIPNEELQSNHDIIGAEVYQYEEDIVVLINEKYWVYTLLIE